MKMGEKMKDCNFKECRYNIEGRCICEIETNRLLKASDCHAESEIDFVWDELEIVT